MNTPLSRLRRLPPALFALARFGQGDNAHARRRSGHGVGWPGLLRGLSVQPPAARVPGLSTQTLTALHLLAR